MSTHNHPATVYTGTYTERLAFDTSGLKRGTAWIESDTNLIRLWDGSDWETLNFWDIASEVVQSVSDYDVRIGQVTDNDEDTAAYGAKLFFSGAYSFVAGGWNSDNSDQLWIARYNVASDETELRINIGDNGEAEDALVIGYTDGGGWNEIYRLETVKQAHIADADGTLADITTKFNTLLDELEAIGLISDV